MFRPWLYITDNYPDVTWTPTRTCSLTVFGQTVEAVNGVELTAPACFYEVYLNSN